MVERVRDLYEAGWSARGIERLMAAEGTPVSNHTILRWVKPEFDARVRSRARSRVRPSRRVTPLSPEHKLARLRRLKKAGLDDTGLAIVARVEFGDDLTAFQVRERLAKGVYAGQRRGPQRKQVA
jgi:hypothetical protein